MGDPPSIDSPPALEVSAGSLMSNVGSSPAGSTTSNSSYQQTPSKRIPGKLALCKQCGTQSDDLAVCIRCKRKFPEDVKLLDDPAFRPKPDSTDSTAKKSSALRGVRPPNKNRKRNNDEPVCIALSDSEEDGEDDFGDPETIDESSGNFHVNILVGQFVLWKLFCAYQNYRVCLYWNYRSRQKMLSAIRTIVIE